MYAILPQLWSEAVIEYIGCVRVTDGVGDPVCSCGEGIIHAGMRLSAGGGAALRSFMLHK